MARHELNTTQQVVLVKWKKTPYWVVQKRATEKPKRKQVDPWLKAVGDNLRRERKAAGLTQEVLAEKADLAPRVVQKIEAGQITILISTLRRLRTVIGCDWKKLLGED